MIKQISVALLGAALSAGCYKTVNTSERAQPIGTPTYIQDKRVLTDGDTPKMVSFNESQAGDLMRVQVVLENPRSTPMSFNYMFEWYDLNGMQVSTPTTLWKSATLQGREQKPFQATAPNSRAKDFKLKLLEMKKS